MAPEPEWCLSRGSYLYVEAVSVASGMEALPCGFWHLCPGSLFPTVSAEGGLHWDDPRGDGGAKPAVEATGESISIPAWRFSRSSGNSACCQQAQADTCEDGNCRRDGVWNTFVVRRLRVRHFSTPTSRIAWHGKISSTAASTELRRLQTALHFALEWAAGCDQLGTRGIACTWNDEMQCMQAFNPFLPRNHNARFWLGSLKTWRQ